jgi:FkbH-like protein
MLEFTRLKKNLKKDSSAFRKIRLGLLCDSSSQLLNIALKGVAIDRGLNFEIYESDYNQIDRQVFDASSGFYQSHPEVTILSISSEKLLRSYYLTEYNQRNSFWKKYEAYIRNLCNEIQQKLDTRIILLLPREMNDAVFGNYASKLNTSFIFQIRRLNISLMELAQENAGIFLCDLQSLYQEYGRKFIADRPSYIRSDLTWSVEFLPILAKNLVDIILSMYGGAKKCLIVDLDNTIWGGVIGDDGIDGIEIGELGIGKAFTELQHWIKELKNRGIIICVCSKNTSEIAKEPFRQHPDMVLMEDDIAVFIANWESKVDNIRHIRSILNIGFDSMVFLDDNPFERELIRREISEITVPELPADPVEYLDFLKAENLFETSTFSQNDANRTNQYKQEAERTLFQRSFKNEDEYLASLEMTAFVDTFNSYNIPRVTQLIQRSNQFNLRTFRYSEDEIQKMAGREDYLPLVFYLSDKFGDSGLISVAILKLYGEEAFIDTWVMSCRVLKRGVENFILNTLVEAVKNKGCKQILGEYLPTKKNEIVKNLLADLGFRMSEGKWVTTVGDFTPLKTFITKKESVLHYSSAR